MQLCERLGITGRLINTQEQFRRTYVAFGGDVKVFDSRSSDSIALAIHFKAPISVGRDLLNSAGVVEQKSKPQDL